MGSERDVVVYVLRRMVSKEEVQGDGRTRWSGEGKVGDPLEMLWTRKPILGKHRERMDSEDGAAGRVLRGWQHLKQWVIFRDLCPKKRYITNASG